MNKFKLNFDLNSRLNELETSLKSPAPLYVIQGKEHDLIQISKQSLKRAGIDLEKYRGIIFIDCSSCQMNVLIKTMKLVFLNCNNCDVQVTNNVLGAIEVIKSHECKLNVTSETPLIQIDLSSDIRINQGSEEVIYVASSCMDVKSYFKSNGTLYNIPCSMYREQYICLLNSSGLEHVVRDYFLNTLEQHVLAK